MLREATRKSNKRERTNARIYKTKITSMERASGSIYENAFRKKQPSHAQASYFAPD